MRSITDIHNSNLFGVVVEAGCGAALAHTLMSVSGSSSTIYHSKQPYSKKYQESIYGVFSRSVSREATEAILRHEWDLIDNSPIATDVNFVITSSWQIGEDGKITHGWYSIRLRNGEIHSFHFTVRNSIGRLYALQRIGEIGVRILHYFSDNRTLNVSYDNPLFFSEGIMMDAFYVGGDLAYGLLIKGLEASNDDYPVVFDNGEAIRFEELMRRSEDVVVLKGSFNPLHHQHVRTIKHAKEIKPGSTAVFLISTYMYDKPHVETDDLINRIKAINDNGYPVIILKQPLFYKTFDIIKSWNNRNNFYFIIGSDTLNRIYQTDYDSCGKSFGDTVYYVDSIKKQYNNRFKFLLCIRKNFELVEQTKLYTEMYEIVTDYEDDGVSSTAIRNGERKNLLQDE